MALDDCVKAGLLNAWQGRVGSKRSYCEFVEIFDELCENAGGTGELIVSTKKVLSSPMSHTLTLPDQVMGAADAPLHYDGIDTFTLGIPGCWPELQEVHVLVDEADTEDRTISVLYDGASIWTGVLAAGQTSAVFSALAVAGVASAALSASISGGAAASAFKSARVTLKHADCCDLAENIAFVATGADKGSPLAVEILDGGDDLLSAAEVGLGVFARVTPPPLSLPGDLIWIDTDADGIADAQAALTAGDVFAGFVDILIPASLIPAPVPDPGSELAVDAYCTRPDPATPDDTASGATFGFVSDNTFLILPPKGELIVTILDGNDAQLTAAEEAAGVVAQVTIAAGSAPGDVLHLDLDQDGTFETTHALVAADLIAGFVDFDVSAQVATVVRPGFYKVEAYCVQSASGAQTPTVDDQTYLPAPSKDAPTISIRDGGDDILDNSELLSPVLADVGLPTSAVAGDSLHLDLDNDGTVDQVYPLTAADIGAGTVAFVIPATSIAAPRHEVSVFCESSANPGTFSDTAFDSTTVLELAKLGPTLEIQDGGDGLLSNAEQLNDTDFLVTLASDAQVGDILFLDAAIGAPAGPSPLRPDYALTAADVAAGTYTFTLPAALTPPAPGLWEASVFCRRNVGGVDVDSDLSTDATFLEAPEKNDTFLVEIQDGGDGIWDLTEQGAAGGVLTIQVSPILPAVLVAGSTIQVDYQNDTPGVYPPADSVLVTAADVTAGFVTLTVPAAELPPTGGAYGAAWEVRIRCVDADGLASDPAFDATVITEPTKGDITVTWIADVDGGYPTLDVAINAPDAFVAGQTLDVDFDNDGILDIAGYIITATDVAAGVVNFSPDAAWWANWESELPSPLAAGDRELTAKVVCTDDEISVVGATLTAEDDDVFDIPFPTPVINIEDGANLRFAPHELLEDPLNAGFSLASYCVDITGPAFRIGQTLQINYNSAAPTNYDESVVIDAAMFAAGEYCAPYPQAFIDGFSPDDDFTSTVNVVDGAYQSADAEDTTKIDPCPAYQVSAPGTGSPSTLAYIEVDAVSGATTYVTVGGTLPQWNAMAAAPANDVAGYAYSPAFSAQISDKLVGMLATQVGTIQFYDPATHTACPTPAPFVPTLAGSGGAVNWGPDWVAANEFGKDGTIMPDGTYAVLHPDKDKFYKVNLETQEYTLVNMDFTDASVPAGTVRLFTGDFVFDPYSGEFVTWDKRILGSGPDIGTIVRINPTTGLVTVLPAPTFEPAPQTAPVNDIGGIFHNIDGSITLIQNNSGGTAAGKLWVWYPGTPGELHYVGPAGSGGVRFNDAASVCAYSDLPAVAPTAPVV